MNNLTSVLENANKLDQAQIIYREILDICKKQNSLKDYDIGSTLCKIALMHEIKKKLNEAEKFY